MILLAPIVLLLVSLVLPQQSPDRAHDLIEVVRLDSTIKLDIRYATSNNFMKRPMYLQARAFLQREVAEALVRAHYRLKHHGFGILLFDAYRPWEVTRQFWEETPPSMRKFVANPKEGSKHNRGCAVDVSLFELASGREVTMPSAYDEFSARAAANYKGGTKEQRRLRDLLRTVMEMEGFTVHPSEWWHFDYRSWRDYPILNVPFDSLR